MGAYEEELNGVMELLQASSESHSDDVTVFQDLKVEIQTRNEKCMEQRRIQKLKVVQQRQQEEATKMQMELELAKQNELTSLQKKMEKEREQKDMDPAKRALLNQYAYDDSVQYDNDGNVISADNGSGG